MRSPAACCWARGAGSRALDLDHCTAHTGPGQRYRELAGAPGVLGEERAGRAGAGDDRAERAVLPPRVQGAAQVRAQRDGRGLQVVAEQRADRGLARAD